MHSAYQARRLAPGRGPSNLDTLASNSATQSPVAQATCVHRRSSSASSAYGKEGAAELLDQAFLRPLQESNL